jgi:arginine decarboxylase
MSPRELAAQHVLVDDLTKRAPPLPDFSAFHDAFREEGSQTPQGDMRRAFYLAYDDSLCEYLLHDELLDKVNAGDSVVSASFVTPYPPGFPVLVPGQVISPEVLSFIGGLDVKEIHGYRAQLGYRVFTEAALQPLKPPARPPTVIAAGSTEDAIAPQRATGDGWSEPQSPQSSTN